MTTTSSPVYQASPPLIDVQEYKDSPTSLDINDLIVGGNAAAQDAELKVLLIRATKMMENYCSQTFSLSRNVERERVILGRDGTVKFAPKYGPVLSVDSFKYGASSYFLSTATDLTGVWIEEKMIVIPVAAVAFSAPLQFGSYRAGGRLYVEVGYTSGFPNTTLAQSVTAGSQALTLGDASGIIAGLVDLTVYDSASTEQVSVASVAGNVVTLTAPLTFAHSAGVTVSATPEDLRQACVYMTNALIKSRGAEALVMGSLSPSTTVVDNEAGSNDLKQACSILNNWRRIW